ncbi:MAG: CRISPR-associated endonuclease Cas1 [Thermoplasmataceae archaeon]
MNPLLLSGFGISIDVNKARLTIKQKDSVKEFEPHRIPYDSIIMDGHYGSISFEAMRWLSKHDVSIALLNWNGNLLSTTLPKETLNAELKIRQYEKYLNPESRLYIAGQIVKQKVQSSLSLIKNLSDFYDIDMTTINKEIQGIDYDCISNLMMYEGRIASAYWSILSDIFSTLAKDFNFQSRKNLSYSWNMNASDPVNALLNYGYAVLESMVRSDINVVGLDPSIGYLHEIAPSKHPHVYDLQELFRYVVDYSVIELLGTGLKKSDFITTENYHIRLKPDTAKKLIEKIKNNFNKRYEFRNKQHTLENIMFENVRELSKYILDKTKSLAFTIPDIVISRNDNTQVRNEILSIDTEKRKELKINKSTLWYQQKKIKEGKPIKVYNKTRVRIE